MRLADEVALSFYRPVADIDAGHTVQLVQHTQTGKFFVKKHLSVYHLDVYQSLQSEPVNHTPRIYLLAEENAGLTVIEEFFPGETLQERLDRDGPMPEEQVVEYALQLCRIVSQLHHRVPPIIHRDIKPSNIIISPDGVLKLLDMNAAKHAHPGQPRDTTLLGTAGYAAPEQYGFGPSGVQTDLFAIGVLMNVLLTGGKPGERPAAGRLAAVIQTCTELDLANRYATVDDLTAALARFTPEQAPLRPLPAWRRFLPPGFHSAAPGHMALALVGYAALFGLGLTLQVENATTLTLALNRAAAIVAALMVVFFSADYCGIQAHLPLTRSRRPALRTLGVFLYDSLILCAVLTALIVLESLL
ncbi:MAG: serine/threonine protein kinase [Oscillospiraceae bacterium]|nr:serine/threonine protein kinase [Oscillospiraceae bacterium]